MANPNPKYQDKSDAIAAIFGLHEGEPWFFIRGRDKLAPAAVQEYSNLLLRADKESDALQVDDFADEFLKWQEEHPDLVRMPSSVK